MTFRAHILGAAAGGGLPQWNCGCANCNAARDGTIPAASQSSVAVSANGSGWAILNAAGLSFIGLGVSPPTAEWGIMVAEGQSFITKAWWITFFPGVSIVVLALGFSLLGDALGDIWGDND